MDNEKSIGSRIKELRKRLDLSQNEFSRKINISKGNLSDLENHKYNPSYSVIVEMIKKFEVNPVWLLLGEGCMFFRFNMCFDENFKPKLYSLNDYRDEKVFKLLNNTTTLISKSPGSVTELNDHVETLLINEFKNNSRRREERRKNSNPDYLKHFPERRSGADRRMSSIA